MKDELRIHGSWLDLNLTLPFPKQKKRVYIHLVSYFLAQNAAVMRSITF